MSWKNSELSVLSDGPYIPITSTFFPDISTMAHTMLPLVSLPLSSKFPGKPLLSKIDTPRFALPAVDIDDITSDPHSSFALLAVSFFHLVSQRIKISAALLILWNSSFLLEIFPRPFTLRDFILKLEALFCEDLFVSV